MYSKKVIFASNLLKQFFYYANNKKPIEISLKSKAVAEYSSSSEQVINPQEGIVVLTYHTFFHYLILCVELLDT